MAGTQPFSLQDAAAYPYVAGVAGTLVDLVAVKSIEQSANIETVENRGDGAVIAAVADFGSLDLTITLGAFTPTSIAAIAGGTVATTGTGTTAITTLVRKSDDVVAYFKLAGQTRTKDSDGGAARVTYPKVAWQGGPDFALTDNEFSEFSISAKALPSNADKTLYTYEAYTTWTALV
ncbi:MAG: hypothetical protein ACR2OE_09505 [Thermomicrobiales bacterium]